MKSKKKKLKLQIQKKKFLIFLKSLKQLPFQKIKRSDETMEDNRKKIIDLRDNLMTQIEEVNLTRKRVEKYKNKDFLYKNPNFHGSSFKERKKI